VFEFGPQRLVHINFVSDLHLAFFRATEFSSHSDALDRRLIVLLMETGHFVRGPVGMKYIFYALHLS
jgi:hypothetical protein